MFKRSSASRLAAVGPTSEVRGLSHSPEGRLNPGIAVDPSADRPESQVLERKRSGKKRRGTRILAILVVLILLSIAVIAGYFFYFGKTFDDTSTQLGHDVVFSSRQPVAEKGKDTNILLMGSDSRVTGVDA